MKTVKQMLDEEKELEDRFNGTPSEEASPGPNEATTQTPDDNTVPVKEVEVGPSNPEPTVQKEVEGEDWEKRFKNLRASREQKLYDAKIGLSNAEAQNLELLSRIEELEKQAVPKEQPISELLSEDERDTLGEAAVGVIEKVTKAATSNKIANLEKDLLSIREANKVAAKNRADQQATDAYSIFKEQLLRIVPEFDDLNKDPGFLKYLGEDDLDGTSRFNKVQQAERRGDAASVGRFAIDYLANKGGDTLATLVTPKANGAAPPTPNATNDTMTQAEVNAIYDKHNRGGFKGKEKEFQELERKIDTYYSEGKIMR